MRHLQFLRGVQHNMELLSSPSLCWLRSELWLFSSHPCAGAVPGMTKGYVLYGKEGTLVLDISAGKLQMGLKAEGGELQEVPVDPAKIVTWRVRELPFPLLTQSNPCIKRTRCHACKAAEHLTTHMLMQSGGGGVCGGHPGAGEGPTDDFRAGCTIHAVH